MASSTPEIFSPRRQVEFAAAPPAIFQGTDKPPRLTAEAGAGSIDGNSEIDIADAGDGVNEARAKGVSGVPLDSDDLFKYATRSFSEANCTWCPFKKICRDRIMNKFRVRHAGTSGASTQPTSAFRTLIGE